MSMRLAEDDEPRTLPFGFDVHEWGVLMPLALVGFFLNYDTGLLSIAAPAIADGLDVSVKRFGVGVAVIRLAALGSLPLLRLADHVGRRRMLLLSVLVFTAATAATSMAWGFAAFVGFQMVARLFLATEESLAGVVISEELRPDRRGAGLSVLGIIAMSGFGLVALMLLAARATPLGWRILYLAAVPPLALTIWLRASLRETRAFTLAKEHRRLQTSLWPRIDRPLRGRLWRIALVLGLHGALSTPMFFYAAELAQEQYGWTGIYTIIVLAAGPATLCGYVIGGRTSDRRGRRPIIAAVSAAIALGVSLVFSEQRWLFAPGFFVMAATDAALAAVRPAYISELFPTEVRSTMLAFVTSVIVAAGSVGLLLVPLLDGVLSTRATILALTVASVTGLLALRGLPETAGTDIYAPEHAAVPRGPST